MQTMASYEWDATSADLRQAFGQANKTTRQQKVAASLPPGMFEAGFKVDPRQLLICETEVYGLISGPSWLRQSLVSYLTKLGYVRNPYEKCAMILPPPVGSDSVENEGIILIEVDDVLEGGNARHKKLMEQFYRQYTFGKRKRIMDEGDTGTLISGRRVRQLKDYSFVWDMDDYADKHM